MHEARPEAPNADEDRFEACAYAREEILVDHEIRLYCVDGLIVLNNQVAIAESIPQRVFDEFIIAMIFSLVDES